MSLSTLIIITIMAGSVPGPQVHTQGFADQAACQRVLNASIQGVKQAYIGNAVGAHKDVQIRMEDGWAVIRTPMSRVVSQLKCQDDRPEKSAKGSGAGGSATSIALPTEFEKMADEALMR